MICYRLRCTTGHEFEGWYKDSQTFTRLQGMGLLSCPECGDTHIQQVLAAPAILKGSSRRSSSGSHSDSDSQMDSQSSSSSTPATVSAKTASNKEAPSAPRLPDALVGVMQRVREVIEKNCDYVGKDFAEEAIRMHNGKAKKRSIYGDVSETDRELLESEGVPFQTIPWVRKADS